MTIDEAITHVREVAEKQRKDNYIANINRNIVVKAVLIIILNHVSNVQKNTNRLPSGWKN